MAVDTTGLSGSQRDAYVALSNLFDNFGLGSLAPTIYNFIVQGYGSDTITLLLQQTDAYKQRFAGNDARINAGLPALSPAEYLSLEASYKQILSSAGMPKGFYDSPSDFADWIGKDVSAAEISARVNDAVKAAQNTDPGYRQMLRQYGIDDGGIAAYFLDTKRALPVLDQTFQSINISEAARQQGLGVDKTRSDQLASLGVTGDKAAGAYSQIADATATFGRAASAFGGTYGQADAENEALLGLASAARKRQQLTDEFNAARSSSTSSQGSNNSGAY